MDTPPPKHDRANSYKVPARRGRRFSFWTIVGPLAAIILWISFFSALGKSCIFKECADAKNTGSQSEAEGDKRNDLDKGARTKVKPGDSLSAIAARFDLTEEELKACNPLVDPQTLRPDTFLFVSAVDCEEADKAETGANPDPLAGDTTAGATKAPDPAKNGTAAADPSAKANAPNAATTKGDEG